MPRLASHIQNKYGQIDRLAFACLLILAALLPYELTRPIVVLGPISLSSVETVLYSLIAVWLITRLAVRRTRWTPIHSAALIWIAAMGLSALFAPSDRADAIKFTLRSLGGCLLFFAVVDIGRTPRRIAAVMTALALGAIVSALAGIAEIQLPAIAQFLLAFKTHPSMIGDSVRASGTFEYANIAGMYWEATLPVVLIISSWWSVQRLRRSWLIAGVIAATILIEAIVLSASRAALIGSILGILIVIALSRAPRSFLRVPGTLALTALIGLAGLTFVANPLFALRLQSDYTADWYRADFHAFDLPPTLTAGQDITIGMQITNTSIQPWAATGDHQVRLSYHWLDQSKQKSIRYESPRLSLPHDLRPAQQAVLTVSVTVPNHSGDYFLQWDLVQEGVTWFSAATHQLSGTEVHVTADASAIAPPPIEPQPLPNTDVTLPPRKNLWQAALRMWFEYPVLGVGPDNFRHRYGPYLGLSVFNDTVTTNNLYLENLTDLGLIGALAFGLFIYKLIETVRKKWPVLTEPSSQILAVGLLVSLATFFIHGLVDTFLAFTPTYGLFWLVSGLLVSLLYAGDA